MPHEIFYRTAEEIAEYADLNGERDADNPWCDGDGDLRGAGWYYWHCYPGCLPDSDPYGPFDTEDEAREAAREDDADEETYENIREGRMVTADHLERVADRLRAESPVNGWPVQWLDQPGTIYLAAPNGVEVYATPGWDGLQTLTVQVVAPDASDFGDLEINVAWTGNVDRDVQLWRKTIEEHWSQILAIVELVKG